MKHSILLRNGHTLVARPIHGRLYLVYIEGMWWTARIRRYHYGPTLKKLRNGQQTNAG